MNATQAREKLRPPLRFGICGDDDDDWFCPECGTDEKDDHENGCEYGREKYDPDEDVN